MKCKNTPSTPPVRLHETVTEKENTLTNDPSTILSANASATASAVSSAVATASATARRPSRVAQHSSQPGYWLRSVGLVWGIMHSKGPSQH
jgi:hypothetical protein